MQKKISFLFLFFYIEKLLKNFNGSLDKTNANFKNLMVVAIQTTINCYDLMAAKTIAIKLHLATIICNSC